MEPRPLEGYQDLTDEHIVLEHFQPKHRDNLYLQPPIRQGSDTTHGWSLEFHVSRNLIDRKLAAIQATPQSNSTRHWPHYSSHSVLAGIEHYQNRNQSLVLIPDPELQTVVAWGESINMHPRGLSTLLTKAYSEPNTHLGRSQAKAYTYEQVSQLLPEAFNQPNWQVRRPGVLVLPGGGDRYVVPGSSSLRRQLKRLNVASLSVRDTTGRPASYYPEAIVRRLQHLSKTIQPVEWREYLKIVARDNSRSLERDSLGILLEQSRFVPDYQVHELDAQGGIELQGRRLVPWSVLIDTVRFEEDNAGRAAFAERMSELERVTLQDVRWPGHWEGAARLWLYDLEEFEQALREDLAPDTILEPKQTLLTEKETQDAQQLAALRATLANQELREVVPPPQSKPSVKTPPPTPPSVPPRRAQYSVATDDKQQARLSMIYQVRMNAAEEMRLRRAWENVERAHQRREAALLDQYRRSSTRWNELKTKARPALRLDVIVRSKQFHTIEGEDYGRAHMWRERFAQAFPQLMPDNLIERLHALQKTYAIPRFFDPDETPIFAERDVLRVLLQVYEERSRR